jgi:hypothetical protein
MYWLSSRWKGRWLVGTLKNKPYALTLGVEFFASRSQVGEGDPQIVVLEVIIALVDDDRIQFCQDAFAVSRVSSLYCWQNCRCVGVQADRWGENDNRKDDEKEGKGSHKVKLS